MCLFEARQLWALLKGCYSTRTITFGLRVFAMPQGTLC